MNNRQKLIQKQFLNNEEAVIKRLKSVYSQSLNDINGNIEKLMKRFDPDTGDLPQSVIYQIKYQEMLKGQVEGILDKMQTRQYLTVSDYLDECYEDGFVGSLFDLHGQGVPMMMPLDQQKMVRAVQLESKISKGLYTKLGEDVNLLKKKITAQVSRSISTGMSYAQTAKQLANYSKIGYNRSVRIARTEGHRIQTTATMDVMEEAKARGADVVKQWDATLDGATRESHVAVDGEIRELDEPFNNGLMYPGDPNGSAAEVVNCRCALLQRARWALDGKFTKMNNFTKQIEEFDSPESYGEFKKAFFSKENNDYIQYLDQMEDKYNTKDFRTVLDTMTDREYDHYSDLLNNNPIYNPSAPDPIQQKYGFNQIAGTHDADGDIIASNPNYANDRNYRINCQRCVPTYEMRRRGYDVEALPYGTANDPAYVGWKDIFQNAVWDKSVASNRSATTMQRIIDKMQNFGDGARGEIYCVWKGASSAHVFAVENIGGKVRFVDPQTGNLDCSSYFQQLMPSRTMLLRIDNLDPSDLIKDCCKNK